MKKTDNRILELADLQKVLLSTCTYLNRQIRKNQLIKITTELFECNTAKEVEFALLDLIEQGNYSKKITLSPHPNLLPTGMEQSPLRTRALSNFC